MVVQCYVGIVVCKDKCLPLAQSENNIDRASNKQDNLKVKALLDEEDLLTHGQEASHKLLPQPSLHQRSCQRQPAPSQCRPHLWPCNARLSGRLQRKPGLLYVIYRYDQAAADSEAAFLPRIAARRVEAAASVPTLFLQGQFVLMHVPKCS